MTVPAGLRTHLSRFCLCFALLLTLLGNCLCQTNVSVDAFVPAEHEVIGEDQYVCFRVDLPRESLKIVGVDPVSTQDVVHHMLLFGCASEGPPNETWPCHMTSPCRGGFERVLYGWGKNAPAMSLPTGVGYSVGPGSAINSLVLQVHYLLARPPGDQSGITLRMIRESTPFSAGMINYASFFTIPPGKPKHPIENQCCYSGFEILKGFAFRVHTHALGRSVNLERITDQKGQPQSQELCRNDPQMPQGFTPLKQDIAIRPGDTLKATCMFDSSNQTSPVKAGATHHDEMCNLYLMLYSQLPYFMSCYGSPQIERHGTGGIPAESRLEPDLHETWRPPPSRDLQLLPTDEKPPIVFGQIAAVSKGHTDDIWVFHRGDVVWNLTSFDSREDGVHIADPTAFVKDPAVVQLNQDTGEVLSSWGSNKFLMPHSLTVDLDGNIWVTDCGLHQAIKFDSKGKQLMALGTRLKPGHDSTHLCKPTHVAVSTDGTIFVSDGYCNARVVRYSAKGAFEAEYRLPRGDMLVPHSLVLEECSDSLYVADRENSEVHRFSIKSQTLQATWNLKLSGNVYAVTAGPYGTILALCWSQRNDPTLEAVNVVLLTDDTTGGGAQQTWRLEGAGAPHDFAVAAAPMPVRGAGDRALALFMAETKPTFSSLRKYLFVPDGSSMEEMVGVGVTESLQPDTRHGIEASLAEQAEDSSLDALMPNVIPHKLSWTSADQLQADAAAGVDPRVVGNQDVVDAAQPLVEPTVVDPRVVGNQGVVDAARPLVEPTVVDPVQHDVLHRHADPLLVTNHPGVDAARPLIERTGTDPAGFEVLQHAEPAGSADPRLMDNQSGVGKAQPLIEPTVVNAIQNDVPQYHAEAAQGTDPLLTHLVNTQSGLDAARPLAKPSGANPVGHDVPHHHAEASGSADPVSVDNQAGVNVAQPWSDPVRLQPGAVEVPHQHAHHAVKEVVNPVVRQGHEVHAEQPGQVLRDNIPGTADPAVRAQPEVNHGAIPSNSANVDAETHDKHFSMHSKDGQEQRSAHDGVFGSQNTVLPQSAGYGGALFQLFSFGLPVACIFAAVAFVLWKRLGGSRPLSHV